jgi:intergrase/recombinase
LDSNPNQGGGSSRKVEVLGSKPSQGSYYSYSYSSPINWLDFKDYLEKSYNHNTAKIRLCYAKRYYHVLLEEDTSDLLSVESGQKRLNIMKALTLLSRYLGRYDTWQQIRKRHNLKWTTGNESFEALQRFFNPGLSLDVMLDWVRKAIAVLPAAMGTVIKHAVLTGLRPSEAVESVRLLRTNQQQQQYYNLERQCLEHFRFPEVFLRRTKKAYISFITLDNLQPIVNIECKTPTSDAIRQACRKKGVNMNMHYCRKIHGSWLHQHNKITSEEIDFLQGRTSPSIFSRHYLTPDGTLKARVLEAVKNLQGRL